MVDPYLSKKENMGMEGEIGEGIERGDVVLAWKPKSISNLLISGRMVDFI